MSDSRFTLTPHDALLVIDMQNDFILPGAPLQVPGGAEIIPGINALASCFPNVIVTQDWHPAGHISFASTHPGQQPFTGSVETHYGTQVLWPVHCLQGSPGAALHADLHIPHAQLILRKGWRRDMDGYSAFFENDRSTPTGLAAFLHERALTRLFVAGLALDFCAGHSATAAARLGFHTVLVDDLTRAVGLPGSLATVEQALTEAAVQRAHSSEITR